MSATPRVTIGLPVFNGQNYLVRAIESLLAQSFSDFELVISDNASTDRTQQICESFAGKDKRIRYLRQTENMGAIRNFNLLVDVARGHYFKWAAHDDVCESTYLQRCVEMLDSNSELVWVHSDSDMIDHFEVSWLDRMPTNDEEVHIDSRGKRSWRGLPRLNSGDTRPSKRFAGVLLGTRWCVDSYGVIRTELLRKTGLFPNIYGSEKVLMGELSLIGKTQLVPEVLFKQRLHVDASAYEDSDAGQKKFVALRDSRPFSSTRLSLLLAHLSVVRRAKISTWERICCYLVLLRYLCQCSKWMRVIRMTLLRKGVGGGSRRIIEIGTKNQCELGTGGQK